MKRTLTESAVNSRAGNAPAAARCHGLTNGAGVLGIAALHHQGLKEVMPSLSAEIEEALLMKRAEEVFIESLMPFEMSHRAFGDAIVVLRRMNERIEEEAKRIAHALHQEAGGLLASTHLALEELARDLSAQGIERLSLSLDGDRHSRPL